MRSDLQARTKQYAIRIIRLFAALPKSTEAQVIGKQFLRSGTAVGANYHEAHFSRSNAEFVSKTTIALQELEETRYWLELLVEAGVVREDQLHGLLQETGELIAIFVTSLKKLKNQPG